MSHAEKERVQKILIPRGTVSGDKDCILEIPWKFKVQPYVIARKPNKSINLSKAHVDRDHFSTLCCNSSSNHPGSGCFYDKTLNASRTKDASTIFQSKTNISKIKGTQFMGSDSLLVADKTDREMMTSKIEDITINQSKIEDITINQPKIKIGSELICRKKYPCQPSNNYKILDCLNFFPPEDSLKSSKSNKCKSSSNDLLQELMELICSIPSQRKSEPTVNMHIHLSKKVEKLLLPLVEKEISNVSLDSESEECDCGGLSRRCSSEEDCQLDTSIKILRKMAMAKQNRSQLNYSLNQTHNSSLNKTPRTIIPTSVTKYHEKIMLEMPHNNTFDQTQRIIIPKNTINSHENTVVEVPQNLQKRHVVVVQGGNYAMPETDQGQCIVQEQLVKKSCTPNCSQACTSYEHVNEVTCTSGAGPSGGCCSPKPVPTCRLPSYCEFCCPSRTCLYSKEHSCSVCDYPKLHCSYSRTSKLGCDFLKPSLNLDFENTNSLHKIKLMKKLEETEKMERQALEADLSCFQNARRKLILGSKDFTSNMSLNDCFLPYPDKSRIEIPCVIKPTSKSNWDKLLGDVKDLSKVLSNSLTNLIPGRSCSATAVRDTNNSNNTSDDEDQEITEVETALRDFQKARRKLISMMQECSSAQNVSILKKSISKKP